MEFNNEAKNDLHMAAPCYSFFVFGTRATQFSLVLAGLVISCLVFRDHPGTGFSIAGISALVPISIATLGLLATGTARAIEKLRILSSGEIVDAILLKIEPDAQHEDMEYRLHFEYSGANGWTKRFETIRTVDDLTAGETIRFLINRKRRVGVLEPDLPGGITFAKVYGTEPIQKKLWVRVLFVPALALVPFLGMFGVVSTFLRQMTAFIGFPLLYWLPIALQLFWYHSNSRHFSPGEVTELDNI